METMLADPSKPTNTALFEVYLRLRPQLEQPKSTTSLYPQLPIAVAPERYLIVEPADETCPDGLPRHITVNPPTDSRRRAVEKYTFTKIFEDNAGQLGVFHGTGVVPLVEGVLGSAGSLGRDGLLATLGVTGSGKTHTILGSRTQRGLTHLSLDLLFRSLGTSILHPATEGTLYTSISASDASEAQIIPATHFFDGPNDSGDRAGSRAATPMGPVCTKFHLSLRSTSPVLHSLRYPSLRDIATFNSFANHRTTSKNISSSQRITRSLAKVLTKDTQQQYPSRRLVLQGVNSMPNEPTLEGLKLEIDLNAEYAILVSFYEVYNDRIFDLLSPQPSTGTINAKTLLQKDRRRPLLFKSTERSPDRKVVAGLRKIICGNLKEAFMVLEAGLLERRTTGTGSNAVSSRSHGFFCVEVMKRPSKSDREWSGSVLTVVDLAGSERARNAKTAGATLAEAGKINESLMYLGQCLQMQSDNNSSEGLKPSLVPFRQCKLTELLFSNSFPSSHAAPTSTHRNPQKAIMIVTADPVREFNATSQILRYSALAREITVPRIPSVTSMIFNGSLGSTRSHSRTVSTSSQQELAQEELIIAAEEIARLTDELDMAAAKLDQSEQYRQEAEANWQDSERRCAAIEADVREECWSDFERKLLEERESWRSARLEEQERVEEHIDAKVSLLANGLEGSIYEDNDEDGRVTELERENDQLRRELERMKRMMHAGSPTKARRTRSVLAEEGTPMKAMSNRIEATIDNTVNSTDENPFASKTSLTMVVTETVISSPMKKVRKLTAKKWDQVTLSPEHGE